MNDMQIPQLPHMQPEAHRHDRLAAGDIGAASAYVAAGEAESVSSQVPGSGAAQAGNDTALFGFWSKKTGQYYTQRFRNEWQARSFARLMSWEYDEEIPDNFAKGERQ